eukprot:7683141-Pyramimonas_sp.AAC.1
MTTVLILASAPEITATATADTAPTDQDESFQADGDHTFDSEDGQAAEDVGLFAGALEAAVTVKKTAKKKGKQRAH